MAKKIHHSKVKIEATTSVAVAKIRMLKLVTPNGAVFREAQNNARMLQDYQIEAATASQMIDGMIADSLRAERAQRHLADKEVRRAYASVIVMASELRVPELRAVWPRKYGKLRFVSWARSGIVHTQERHDGATRVKTDSRGESDYTCMFCCKSIQTFGWSGGGTLPQAFVEGLEKHVGVCAVDYLVNYERERANWQLTPNAPKLVDDERIMRETPP